MAETATKPRGTTTYDCELSAMAKMVKILDALSDDSQTRVIDWLVGRNNQKVKDAD